MGRARYRGEDPVRGHGAVRWGRDARYGSAGGARDGGAPDAGRSAGKG